MREHNINFYHARRLVRGMRNCIKPNRGFVRQLLLWHRLRYNVKLDREIYFMWKLEIYSKEEKSESVFDSCFVAYLCGAERYYKFRTVALQNYIKVVQKWMTSAGGIIYPLTLCATTKSPDCSSAAVQRTTVLLHKLRLAPNYITLQNLRSSS